MHLHRVLPNPVTRTPAPVRRGDKAHPPHASGIRRYLAWVIPGVMTVALSIPGVVHARTSIAVFPARCVTASPVYQWFSAAFSDYMFHSLQQKKECQVWDPVFLFGIDSSAWHMEPDTLLRAHWERWHWNVVIGGDYRIANDTLHARVKIGRYDGKTYEKSTLEDRIALSDDIPAFLSRLCTRTCTALNLSVPSRHHLYTGPLTAYSSYAMGLYYEMRGKYSAALSAFYTACDHDPKYTAAYLHCARIFQRSGYSDSTHTYLKKALSTPSASSLVYGEYCHHLCDRTRYSRAASFMETHLNTLKRSPTGLSAIARVHAHQGNPDRAIVALTRALDAGPIDLRCRELLARMYVNRQDYEHAYELYRNLITRRPTHIPYYLSLGNAYRKEGDLMESLTILQEARQIAPGHDGVYNSLGHTYFELAWYDKAASAFEKALAIRSSPQALINLAVVALKNGNAAKADSIFGTISHRRISSALTNTANLRMRAGDYKKAASLYKKALHKDGSNWKILYNLSLAHQAQGKYKKARSYLRTLQKLQPDNIEVHMLSAQVEEKLGHLQDASGHYEKILSQSPANQQALSAMCDLLVEQGKEKEAVAHLEKYLEYAPENVDILLRIAEIYIRMGWYQVATAKYENIVADHPEHPRAYLGWAQAIYRNLKEKNRGDWHAAVQLAQKAGQLTDENNPHVHILLGKLYLYNNDTSRARTHLRTAQTAAGDEPHLKKEIDHLLQHAL